MKKIISKIAIITVLFASLSMPTTSQAVVNWDVSGTYVWNVFGAYFHDITLVQGSSGTFTGTGSWPSGGPEQTGEIISNGLVSGNDISFTVTYTGPYGAGSVYNMIGTIDTNGVISGTIPWNWSLDGGVAHVDDMDGVPYASDKCPSTTNDTVWDVAWGNNRWQVQDGVWYQNKVGKKGVTYPTMGQPIAYTYGCNGHQILQMLKDQLGDVMNGHWKYGISSGLLEEFHKDLSDGVLDGMYLIDTVSVPANSSVDIASSVNLLSGHNYVLKASGTAMAGDGITFDADYSYRIPSSSTWTDSVSTYESYGDTLLDLVVNGGFVNWDDDTTYNTNHTYSYSMMGSGLPVTFRVNDVYYPNNTGSLMVDIFAQI